MQRVNFILTSVLGLERLETTVLARGVLSWKRSEKERCVGRRRTVQQQTKMTGENGE